MLPHLFLAGVVLSGATQPLYRDATQPVNVRVSDLLSKMTIEEKVAQLLNPFSSADSIVAAYKNGVGGAWGVRLRGSDKRFTNDYEAQNWLQESIINSSRHGIPVSVYVEGLHGGPGGGTIFPAPVNVGNTWNVTLARLIGAAIGAEARIGGCDRVFGPELQVDTDARFGRFYESFSEDPHLVGVFGMFTTQGVQGPPENNSADMYLDPTKAACEAKHMAAYGNAGKDGAASEVSEATFFNKYWYPWILYAESGGRGVMPSHQLTTAFMLPSHANKFMLTGLWRGVQGMNQTFISSDCGDIGQLKTAFSLASDDAEAAAVAINAGVDQDLCVSSFPQGLPAAIKRGLVSLKTIDDAAGNILRQKFAAGLFEGSWKVDLATVASKLDSYRPLALETARQGITLLTNVNKTLPLQFKHKRIVVVGALADDMESHVGGYTNGGAAVVTTWAAIQKECAASVGCTATKVDGAAPGSFDTSGLQAAADAVATADLVIAVVGDDTVTAGENHDVDDLDLPGAQLPLLWAVCQAAAEHGTPVVGVVISAQPKTFGASLFNPVALGKPNFLVTGDGMLTALLAAWRPGEEGGTAIVDIITGKYNPSGRLSHTWPAKAGQVHSVVANNYRMPASNAGGSIAFTTGPIAPLFPFGWGLSYASFKVGTPVTSTPVPGQPANSTQRFSVKVPVTCKGPAGSQTTLQVYTKANFQLVGQSQPVNRLLCWGAVVFADADGTETATLSCAVSDLGMWDIEVGDYIVKGGQYTIHVGLYAGDKDAQTATVEIAGSAIPAKGQSMRDRARKYAGMDLV